jgi:hypothetical protein
MSSETLRMVYFSYFHCMIKYGLIFWGNSTNISRVFKLQKKVIRIISGVGPADSCRGLFRKSDILPLSCEYILSLTLFVIDNQNNFRSGSGAVCVRVCVCVCVCVRVCVCVETSDMTNTSMHLLK